MCNDKAINYLSSIGFSAIQLPMMGIEPLHLMRIRENDYLESLGPVVNLIEPCTERLTPDIKKDCKVTDPHLDGLVTDSFGFNIGTGIVNDILKQFGLQNDILKQFGFSYQKVKKVKFSFDNILCDATTVAQLARYLRTGQLVDLPKFLDELIIDRTMDGGHDDGKFNQDNFNPISKIQHTFHAVVIKTLKSNSFSVWAYNENDLEVNLNLQLPDNLSITGGCKVLNKSENLLTFEGDKHLVFGVQLANLYIEKRGLQKGKNSFVCKFDSPDNVDGFTGELFPAPENSGLHPIFVETQMVKGKEIPLVKLNHGNPIRIKG
jgi:hypothetical protein